MKHERSRSADSSQLRRHQKRMTNSNAAFENHDSFHTEDLMHLGGQWIKVTWPTGNNSFASAEFLLTDAQNEQNRSSKDQTWTDRKKQFKILKSDRWSSPDALLESMNTYRSENSYRHKSIHVTNNSSRCSIVWAVVTCLVDCAVIIRFTFRCRWCWLRTMRCEFSTM